VREREREREWGTQALSPSLSAEEEEVKKRMEGLNGRRTKRKNHAM
jgi:hypothetical protein